MGPLDAPPVPRSLIALIDGVARTIKPQGNGKAGIIDWTNDDSSGYLFHLHTGPNSTADTAAIGIGTDRGHGAGLLISHKNDNAGFALAHNPGSGIGAYWQGYSPNPLLWAQAYAGSGGVQIDAATGQGFADGATTAGSTTFTSATANFTSADIGATVLQLTSKGTTDSFGAIPAGGLQIVSVTNATTVVLSAAPTITASAILFRVSGRAPAPSLSLLRVRDTDSTVIAEVTRSRVNLNRRAVVTGSDTGNASLRVVGAPGASSNLFEVIGDGQPAPSLAVEPSGKMTGAFGVFFSNAGLQSQPAFQVVNYGSGQNTFVAVGANGQTGDQLQLLDGNYSLQSRFNKGGYFMTKKTAAPADADLTNGEMAVWFDPTNGAAKLMIKAKEAGGTVRTGSVALA